MSLRCCLWFCHWWWRRWCSSWCTQSTTYKGVTCQQYTWEQDKSKRLYFRCRLFLARQTMAFFSKKKIPFSSFTSLDVCILRLLPCHSWTVQVSFLEEGSGRTRECHSHRHRWRQRSFAFKALLFSHRLALTSLLQLFPRSTGERSLAFQVWHRLPTDPLSSSFPSIDWLFLQQR